MCIWHHAVHVYSMGVLYLWCSVIVLVPCSTCILYYVGVLYLWCSVIVFALLWFIPFTSGTPLHVHDIVYSSLFVEYR